MPEQIIANASRIFELDNGLSQTVSQIDLVIFENEELIRNTKNYISRVQEEWEKRKSEAFRKLMDAQQKYSIAKNTCNDDSEISFYYQNVVMCETAYNNICKNCIIVEKIKNDFLTSVSIFERNIDIERQKYINNIKKSSHILLQYGELIRKSSEISSKTASKANTPYKAVDSNSNNFISNNTQIKIQTESEKPCNNILELLVTNQTWVTNPDGSMVFNTPVETGLKLDSNQGKMKDFQGTCGLVSVGNILRLAGYPATEEELVTYASTTLSYDSQKKYLCETDSLPENNGGTNMYDRQKILSHFGVASEFREATIDNIAEAVSEGRGVIISVYSPMLYYGKEDKKGTHAIAVTSVKKDRNGNICGFYVCDSGTGGVDNAKYYTKEAIENSLTGRPLNVTSIIR